jgi:hypothetical protein
VVVVEALLTKETLPAPTVYPGVLVVAVQTVQGLLSVVGAAQVRLGKAMLVVLGKVALSGLAAVAAVLAVLVKQTRTVTRVALVVLVFSLQLTVQRCFMLAVAVAVAAVLLVLEVLEALE